MFKKFFKKEDRDVRDTYNDFVNELQAEINKVRDLHQGDREFVMNNEFLQKINEASPNYEEFKKMIEEGGDIKAKMEAVRGALIRAENMFEIHNRSSAVLQTMDYIIKLADDPKFRDLHKKFTWIVETSGTICDKINEQAEELNEKSQS